MNKGMKKIKKIVMCLVLCMYLITNMCMSIMAVEISGFESLINNNNFAEMVDEYFYEIYENSVKACLIYGDLKDKDINFEDLTVGNSFVIFDTDLNANGRIWYYPIYNNKTIVKIMAVFIYDNKLNSCLTGEYVEKLNEYSYDNDMIIIKENNNTYMIDKNNLRYFLYEDGETEITNRTYLEWKNYIKENYNYNYEIEVEQNEYNLIQPCVAGGSTIAINNGRECLISDCFTRQYNYTICWAACVATIVKYLRPEYINLGLNAFDVALDYGEYLDGIDVSTEQGRTECMQGRYIEEVRLGMACIYDIVYSFFNRKLSFEEVKNQIQNGYPIYIRSEAEYEDENGNQRASAHGTVIYGYYYYGSTQYIEMWNPATASVQQVTYNLSGDVYYVFNSHEYNWVSSCCNGLYVNK